MFFVFFWETSIGFFKKLVLYFEMFSNIVLLYQLHMGPVTGRPACSATDTSDDSEMLHDASLVSLLSW